MAEVRARADVEALAAIAAIEPRLNALLERDLPAGISAAAFAALDRLSRADAPAGPADLADALSLTRSAVTHTLGRLEARGLVTLAADPEDGRRKRLALTPAGVALHRDCAIALRPRLAALRAAAPLAEFEAALPLLRRLRAWLNHESAAKRATRS